MNRNKVTDIFFLCFYTFHNCYVGVVRAREIHGTFSGNRTGQSVASIRVTSGRDVRQNKATAIISVQQ